MHNSRRRGFLVTKRKKRTSNTVLASVRRTFVGTQHDQKLRKTRLGKITQFRCLLMWQLTFRIWRLKICSRLIYSVYPQEMRTTVMLAGPVKIFRTQFNSLFSRLCVMTPTVFQRIIHKGKPSLLMIPTTRSPSTLPSGTRTRTS